MFKSVLKKLQEAHAEYDDMVKRIIRQNQDLEELSEELLGEKCQTKLWNRLYNKK